MVQGLVKKPVFRSYRTIKRTIFANRLFLRLPFLSFHFTLRYERSFIAEQLPPSARTDVKKYDGTSFRTVKTHVFLRRYFQRGINFRN